MGTGRYGSTLNARDVRHHRLAVAGSISTKQLPSQPDGLAPDFESGQYRGSIPPRAAKLINSDMRYNEIITELHYSFQKVLMSRDWKSPDEVTDWLISAGFRFVNSGFYAKVYYKPGYKNVVKVTTREDLGWLEYANYTRKIVPGKIKSLPNIWWIQEFGERRDNVEDPDQFPANFRFNKYFISLIEKLNDFDEVAISETNDLTALAYIFLFLTSDWSDLIEARLVREEIIVPTHPTLFDYDQVHKWYTRNKSKCSFTKTMKVVKGMRKKSGYTVDMHDDNIMYRPSDKSIVITDPLST